MNSMKKLRLLATICCLLLAGINMALAQNKLLLFYDTAYVSEVKLLLAQASAKKMLLDTTSRTSVFTESNLKNYQVVIFMNVSANRLSFREAAELQRFLQAGGGFAGIGKAAEASYKWLWYANVLGGQLAATQLEKPIQLSIITNAFLGKTTLPPLWKLNDKPLLFNDLPTKCKPVLLDVTGKTWAWYYTTEQGGKLFYTALGCEPSAYQSPDFISHVWAGIEEVMPKNLPDYASIASTALPSEKNFLKTTLSNDFQNPVALATLRDNNIIVVEENGEVKIYEPQLRKTSTIGKIDVTNLKRIKLDPEFYQNGYIYTFSGGSSEEYKIGRMQLIGDTTVVMTDFASQSNNPLPSNIIYYYEKYVRSPYRLPQYFDKKSFRYDNEQGLIVETFDEDNNVKNIEPFLTDTPFNYITDMSFGADGGLYILEDKQLKKIDYSETNRKPLAIASADVMMGNAPLKVKFFSDRSIDYDSSEKLSVEWIFGGAGTSAEVNPEFTFTKPGTYDVGLKVTDNAGESAETTLKIQVNKPAVKKR